MLTEPFTALLNPTAKKKKNCSLEYSTRSAGKALAVETQGRVLIPSTRVCEASTWNPSSMHELQADPWVASQPHLGIHSGRMWEQHSWKRLDERKRNTNQGA